MGRQLKATVYLHDEDGVVRGFGPGDTVPDWVAAQITNPDAWADDDSDGDTFTVDEPVDDDDGDTENVDGPPPRTGKGSGLPAWTAYAESIGFDVPEGATRDDIIAAIDADAGQ